MTERIGVICLEYFVTETRLWDHGVIHCFNRGLRKCNQPMKNVKYRTGTCTAYLDYFKTKEQSEQYVAECMTYVNSMESFTRNEVREVSLGNSRIINDYFEKSRRTKERWYRR